VDVMVTAAREAVLVAEYTRTPPAHLAMQALCLRMCGGRVVAGALVRVAQLEQLPLQVRRRGARLLRTASRRNRALVVGVQLGDALAQLCVARGKRLFCLLRPRLCFVGLLCKCRRSSRKGSARCNPAS
jgi:hypothetical protein